MQHNYKNKVIVKKMIKYCDKIDRNIIWNTINNDIKDLKNKLQRIL